MKRFKVNLFLFSLLLFPFLSFSDVESVKVGGDITVRGIWWRDMDLRGEEYPVEDWLDSTLHVNVSVDLSDNVSVFISLINERDWNVEGDGGVNPDNSSRVDLDLAYLTLAQIYGSPVSLSIGRQELIYGEAFLVGANPEAPAPIHYPYGARVGFDAIKLNFAREPWSIDLFKAKVTEGYGMGNDFDLYGVNTHLSRRGEWDFALFYKHQNPEETGVNETYALSVRGEGDVPRVKGLSLKGEVVKEWGKVAKDALDAGYPAKEVNRDAWGGYVGATYTFDNLSQPHFGLTYVYESGDKKADKRDGKIEAFDSLCEDEAFGIIADGGASDYLDTSSNKSLWIFSAGFKPNEKLSLDLKYYNYRLAEPEYNSQGEKTSKNAGYECDLLISYDYSEDVNFSLWYAFFHPGKYIKDMYGSDYDKEAKELGFSLSVSF
ncbi:MAG: alginate export family protein [Caldiserica bacterium]|nr:alginate export family protein [Caldisericota bacterium]